MNKLIQKYNAPTPAKMQKLGDALVIAIPILQTAVYSLPISLDIQAWVGLGIAAILAVAKFLTSFYSE